MLLFICITKWNTLIAFKKLFLYLRDSCISLKPGVLSSFQLIKLFLPFRHGRTTCGKFCFSSMTLLSVVFSSCSFFPFNDKFLSYHSVITTKSQKKRLCTFEFECAQQTLLLCNVGLSKMNQTSKWHTWDYSITVRFIIISILLFWCSLFVFKMKSTCYIQLVIWLQLLITKYICFNTGIKCITDQLLFSKRLKQTFLLEVRK